MDRETLEVDVLFVGAGPASLAGAIHLSRLARQHDQEVDAGRHRGPKLGELNVAVIEKGASVSSHAISGAVFDPRALCELLPPAELADVPWEAPVGADELRFLTAGSALKAPITPPPLRNHSYYVASLGKLNTWLAARAEAEGVNLFCEFPGSELLIEGDQVVGVRTGDKGIDRKGERKANFEPGVDLMAKLTLLGEGPRGTLTKRLVERFRLDRGREPQVYAIGIKELWELPDDRFPAGKVVHTMGWPLRSEEFGGAFLYGMQGRILDLGFVAGLDYKDPLFDPHHALQRFKTHPFIRPLLEGAKLVGYGAKAIPEGGLWAMPRLYAGGVMLIGDSAGFLNPMRLKGIHLAMKSGMLAAETALDALLAGDASEQRLAGYQRRFEQSWAFRELRGVRNFHPGFEHGMLAGLINAGLMMISGGRGFGVADRLAVTPGHLRMEMLGQRYPEAPTWEPPRYDGQLTFDKLTDLYSSGTKHIEDQPAHLLIADWDICNGRCKVEYGNPCQRFCPASVYEMVAGENGASRLQLNPSNCVHCKTCDILDPYQIITWVPPEGGGGPAYQDL